MRRLAMLLAGVALAGPAACTREPSNQPAAQPHAQIAADGAGSDWPCFLGLTGDSKSSERGILTAWPAEGPPLVWQLALGTGYSMPTIAAGRLYQFDRDGDHERLRCLESRTGKLLWKFEYESDFEDLYGYDNGPRSSPLVDDGRVYIFGAEGMLHCLDAAAGKVIWKLNTAQEFAAYQDQRVRT